MKQLIKKVLASTKTTIVLSILFVIFFAIDFEIIASYLYGDENPSNKGQLFGTALTAIGGICVIWGLWLNNKKVNEQTRQNNITVQNSNDKRFGEAIGYLNDDNEGIAIGGIYALYQLAKEDERYAPIITNIFYNYVNDNTDKQDKKSYQTILSLLFSKDNHFVFEGEIKFQDITLIKETLYLNNSRIKFFNCNIQNVTFKYGKTIDIESSRVDSSSFEHCINICISNCEVTNDTSIWGDNMFQVTFLNCFIFFTRMFIDKIKSLSFYSCQLQRFVVVEADNIESLHISQMEKLDSDSSIIVNVKKSINYINKDDNHILEIHTPMN